VHDIREPWRELRVMEDFLGRCELEKFEFPNTREVSTTSQELSSGYILSLATHL
jgi:hypothetical protein